MKCTIFVSERMGNIPVAECGGITLAPGDELVVKSELADKLAKHYGSRLSTAGEVDKEKLANGNYELKRGGNKPFNQDPKKVQPLASASSMEDISADKSLIGKKVTKKKAAT